ncbi:putative lipoprotein [Acetobacter orientalis]|uniref:Putative lipoprotein n=1 Tax=Acetobacter orientalis TaxID=146474 RepID=A0A2Z5ZF66_9PROT|nr:putative lipoprotein [Acetobacter orientalis]
MLISNIFLKPPPLISVGHTDKINRCKKAAPHHNLLNNQQKEAFSQHLFV